MLKRTPLFEAHQKLGGKLIEFGGWEMPVQYSSIMDEHQAVRTAAGLFDISHMGEVVVSGPQAEAFLNQTLTNDVRELAAGRGQYTLMCNERGGVIDDLYIFRLMRTEFLLIINASRTDRDVEWMTQRLASGPCASDVKVTNASNRFGAVAVQGPRVKEFINGCIVGSSAGPTEVDQASDLQKNELGLFNFNRMVIYVARTGYTGEDGFEIFAPLQIVAIWNKLLEVGRPFGLKPCGLGARDTLRTEMCYPLYGQELDEQTTPIEAGLGFFVALDKGDFVGRTALAEQKEKGVSKRCVAFRMTDKSAPPRPHYGIWSTGADAKHIGDVVSGTQSPSLGIGVGMGYVPPQFAKPGTALEIEIRGKRAPAVVVQKPVYRKPTQG